MKAKFKTETYVDVSGAATGLGDMVGWITEVNYDKLAKIYFYKVIIHGTPNPTHYVNEKFLSKQRK